MESLNAMRQFYASAQAICYGLEWVKDRMNGKPLANGCPNG